MQLSAANLLIASQQIARGSHQPSPKAQAEFASALAKENGVPASGFEPMDFKQTAPAAKATVAVPAQAPAASYTAASPIGGKIDIRV